jgi:hypothetical protein
VPQLLVSWTQDPTSADRSSAGASAGIDQRPRGAARAARARGSCGEEGGARGGEASGKRGPRCSSRSWSLARHNQDAVGSGASGQAEEVAAGATGCWPAGERDGGTCTPPSQPSAHAETVPVEAVLALMHPCIEGPHFASITGSLVCSARPVRSSRSSGGDRRLLHCMWWRRASFNKLPRER